MTPAATPLRVPHREVAVGPHRWLPTALTAVCAVAVTAACSPSTPAETSTAPRSSAAASAVEVTTVTTIDGHQTAVPGPAATALFFFTVGCGECIDGGRSLAHAQTAVAHAHGTTAFLAVDMDPHEDPAAISGFLAQVGAQNVPAVIDANATLSRTYQVSALSTLIVVTSTGAVTYRATDPTADDIVAAADDAGAK